jgi:uncharacterized protein
VITRDEPLATVPGKPPLYRVADSNLRLYLAMLRTAQEHGRRGHPETAVRLVRRRWTSWRGRAVEPIVRQALERASLAATTPWPEVEVVGGWWNRRFDPEIDLVGADRAPVARRISFVGSVKWLGSPFDAHDLGRLVAGARQVPGFEPGATGLAVVSLSGVAPGTESVDLV